MLPFGGEVDGAAEDAEDASIHVAPIEDGKPLVELHGVATLQIEYPLDAQKTKIIADARAYTGNRLKRVSRFHWGILQEEVVNSAAGTPRGHAVHIANRAV